MSSLTVRVPGHDYDPYGQNMLVPRHSNRPYGQLNTSTMLGRALILTLLVLACLLRRTSWIVDEEWIVEADVDADDDVMAATDADSP